MYVHMYVCIHTACRLLNNSYCSVNVSPFHHRCCVNLHVQLFSSETKQWGVWEWRRHYVPGETTAATWCEHHRGKEVKDSWHIKVGMVVLSASVLIQCMFMYCARTAITVPRLLLFTSALLQQLHHYCILSNFMESRMDPTCTWV